MRRIDVGGQFRKDLKLARRRNLPEDMLNAVIWKLANDEPLSPENRDHALHGDYEGTRECHIQPDWLLVYSKMSEDSLQVLQLIRTGTHSDLF